MGADSVFVSYSRKYSDWTKILVDNLTRCGVEAFLDERDIGAGLSWVSRIEEGLCRSARFVLVATPEALASPRVLDELDALVTRHRDWVQAGRLLLAMLVQTPLPPFSETIEYTDFVEHNRDRYLEAFGKLLAGARGLDSSSVAPRLPDDIEVPDPPETVLPSNLRSQIVDWAAVGLKSRGMRRLLATALDPSRNALDGFGSPQCAASAALVLATKSDHPITAAVRFVELVVSELCEDVPELEQTSAALLDALTEAQATGGGSGLLDAYLSQVSDDHGNLVPYFRRSGAAAVLDRVYVRLELRAQRRTVVEEDRGPAPSDALCITDLLTLDANWATGRWVVKGDPGSGKTTLLRHLAWELCGGRGNGEEAPGPWVPLYAPIPALVREELDPVSREDRRFRRVFGKEGLGQVLDREGKAGRLLLLLDGLDEVPKELRSDAEHLLRGLSRRWPKSPIVVAARSIGYRPFDGSFVEVEVLPLDRARRVEFLARWLGAEDGAPDMARAGAAVDRLTGSLWDISGTPLYLTLMAILLQQDKAPDCNRAVLYDQIFDLLLKGGHRDGGDTDEFPVRPATEAALRHLGFSMTEANLDGDQPGDLVVRLYEMADERSLLLLERRWRRDLDRFLATLAERTGILGPHDGEGEDWRFWHRSFREALAAQRMEEKVVAEGGKLDACLLQAGKVVGDESRWAEPFALLMGRLPEPDRLVRELMDKNVTLGLRALATAQSVQAETLHEVLQLTDDRNRRSAVFSDIPRLLSDPERAVLLLERLARQTTDGSDLFFIHQAVCRIAAEHPELQRRTTNTLRHLYDHLAAPDDELFCTVIGLDGEVPLLTEIPAGEFTMGSPDAETDRHGGEGPQHRVSILRPFRASVVPVTHAMYEAFDPNHRRDRDTFEGKISEEELDRHPVFNVSWHESMSFCRWLSARHPEFLGARLPTEAEWEYMCRAGTETRFWSGDDDADLTDVGWTLANSGNKTHSVGQKPKNPWGLYDVHGNVWEWCWDPAYRAYKDKSFRVDPKERPNIGDPGANRVFRGGSWNSGAKWARAAFRNRVEPSFRWRLLGFRPLIPRICRR